jgi:hypothetical protein
VLDAGTGIGVGVDQRERFAPVADDSEVLGMPGEAQEQDVAGRRVGDRLCNEVLLAECPQLLAIGDAAIGASVELEQAELLADTDACGAHVAAEQLALGRALVTRGYGAGGQEGRLLEPPQWLGERQQRGAEQDHHHDQPRGHQLAVGRWRERALQQRARDRRAEHAAEREHESGERVGILADEGEPAGAIRMGRDQPELQPRQISQQQAPHRMPPQPAQQQEPEQGTADQDAPPAGGGEPRPLGSHTHEPGRRLGSEDEPGTAQGDRVGRDHADHLGEPQIAPPQRPHDRLGRGRQRAGSEQRRAHELAEMNPEPLLDQALHQHENPDRDEKARPRSEVEQERPARGRADRIARDRAEQQRHDPSEPDQNCGASASAQCMLA